MASSPGSRYRTVLDSFSKPQNVRRGRRRHSWGVPNVENNRNNGSICCCDVFTGLYAFILRTRPPNATSGSIRITNSRWTCGHDNGGTGAELELPNIALKGHIAL